MVVVAGPAGSGKTSNFPLRAFGVDFFNVDDRCAELDDGSYSGILPALRAQVAVPLGLADRVGGLGNRCPPRTRW